MVTDASTGVSGATPPPRLLMPLTLLAGSRSRLGAIPFRWGFPCTLSVRTFSSAPHPLPLSCFSGAVRCGLGDLPGPVSQLPSPSYSPTCKLPCKPVTVLTLQALTVCRVWVSARALTFGLVSTFIL